MKEENTNPSVVFDSSSLLSFLMPDEVATQEVQKIVKKLIRGEISVIAPSLLQYEIANTLKTGIKRRRIQTEKAKELLNDFLNLGIKYVNINLPKTLSLAVKYDLSFYDASYLHLARKNKIKLYSFDGDLVKLANK